MDFKILYNLCGKDTRFEGKKNIHMQRPKIVHVMEEDEKLHLLYFKQPQIKTYPLDLNLGFIPYEYSHEEAFKSGMTNMESYIMKSNLCKQTNTDENNKRSRICTQLSVLYHIMLIPYRQYPSLFHNFTICATKYNGIIYLVQKMNNGAQGHWKSESYHSRLKQYCFTNLPKDEVNIMNIDANRKTPCTYNTQIGTFDISYTANLCGVISDEEIKDVTNLDQLNQLRFVLTKCAWKSEKFPWYTHYKILNWWIQAFLNNVQDIYVAIKDRDGCVRGQLEHKLVNDLPKNKSWQPDICIQFLNKYLSKVQEIMSDINCPHTVFEIQYDAFKKCILYKKHEAKTDESFLSNYFVEYLQKK